MKILYINDAGGLAIVIPTDLSIDAKQEVPLGKPFKIVDDADIPTDRALRDAWTVDVSDLTDGIGSRA